MINLLPDSDQQAVIDSVAGFLNEEFPVSRLRDGSEFGASVSGWPKIADFGCFGLALPDEQGGAGFTLTEQVLAFREFGRVLLSPAVLATTIAAHLAAACGQTALLAKLLAGSCRAAPGMAREAGESFMVIDSAQADFVLIHEPSKTVLYSRDVLNHCSSGRALDDAVTLDYVAIDGPAALQSSDLAISRRSQLLISAMLVGISETTRDMAVAYGKERQQFGQPIGGFQAIKHRCADMAIGSEMALAQLLFAAIQERDGKLGAPFHGAAAAVLALDAALQNSAASIQVHGGIGFTAGHDAHRYLKRANLLEQLGAPMYVQQRRLLAEAYPSSA